MKRFALILCFLLSAAFLALAANVDPRTGYDRVWEGEDNGKAISYALKLTPDNIVVQEFLFKGRKWRQTKTSSIVYFDPDANVSLGDIFECREINGKRYCICSVLESYDGGYELSYRLPAVSVSTGEIVDVLFRGKNLSAPSLLPSEYLIEGSSNADMLPDSDSLVVGYLSSLLDADSRLKVFPESLFLTDKTIEWWVENNPKAMTSARSVQMPVIDSEASLVSEYENVRKVKGAKFSAAVFDTRGYCVIVAKRNSSPEYALAWAEPSAVDKSRDRYVKSIYFQSDNTLAVIFYKGKSMFKYNLNLATHELSR